MTKNKRESEAKARKAELKHKQEVANLEGEEKLKYDKSVIERRIRETKHDIEKFGETEGFKNKLNKLEKQLGEINKKLEDIK